MEIFNSYVVIEFQNETCTRLTVDVLNKQFPNVEFSYENTSYGTSRISVRGKYAEFIHPHTMKMFLSEAVKSYEIVSVVVASMGKGGMTHDGQ